MHEYYNSDMLKDSGMWRVFIFITISNKGIVKEKDDNIKRRVCVCPAMHVQDLRWRFLLFSGGKKKNKMSRFDHIDCSSAEAERG